MKVMITKPDKNKARLKRHLRVRRKIQGTALRPRLNVYRSSKHIYAQLIDDVAGVTIASASTVDKELSEGLASGRWRQGCKRSGRQTYDHTNDRQKGGP